MELVKSIQSMLYERIASPLASMFFLSWSIFHYELIMMMLSDLDMRSKTQFIYEWMIVDTKNNWGSGVFLGFAPYWYGLFKPILYSFVVLISYSLMSVPAYWISMKGRRFLQDVRRSFDNEAPVRAIVHHEIVEAYQKTIQGLNDAAFKSEKDMEAFRGLYQGVLKEKDMLLLASKSAQYEEFASNASIPQDGFKSEVPEYSTPVGVHFSGTFYELFFESENSNTFLPCL